MTAGKQSFNNCKVDRENCKVDRENCKVDRENYKVDREHCKVDRENCKVELIKKVVLFLDSAFCQQKNVAHFLFVMMVNDDLFYSIVNDE